MAWLTEFTIYDLRTKWNNALMRIAAFNTIESDVRVYNSGSEKPNLEEIYLRTYCMVFIFHNIVQSISHANKETRTKRKVKVIDCIDSETVYWCIESYVKKESRNSTVN